MDDGFDDPELEAIRQQRMQGMQNQFGGSNMEAQQREAEKKRQMEEARQHILKQILTPEARERLSRVALVKPENARAVEDLIIKAAQSGQLTQRVDEPKLIQLLEQLNETKKSTKITPKNKFIDKKNAESFRVVHRSQRDLEKLENDNEASNLVLAPVKTDSKYEGTKIDLPKEVLPGKEVQDVKLPFMPRPELFMEVDEEIERALENPDEEEWEELDDDFVAQANKEAPEYQYTKKAPRDIWADNEEDDEYYDDEEQEEDPNDWDEDIDEEAAKYLKNPPKRFLEKWKRDVQFADADHSIQKTEKVDLNTITDESRKMLEARFEKTLNMYDDDDIGELDDEDPTVHGSSNINLFEDVLDDFIHKTTKFTLNDFTTEELTNTSVRSVKQKTLIIPSIGHWDEAHEKNRKKKQLQIEEDEEDLDDIDDYQPQSTSTKPNFEDDDDLEEFEDEDDDEEEPRPARHQFDDAEEYDPEKKIEEINKAELKTHHNEADLERYVVGSDSEGEQKEWIKIHQEDEHWDCQSILSTYSNTDNHPKLIVDEPNSQKIKLSQKTGLPVGVIKGKKQEKEKEKEKKSAADLGVARPKGETKEEKKLRKQMVKQQKQQSREKKKILKMAYKNEELNQKYLIQQIPPPTIKL